MANNTWEIRSRDGELIAVELTYTAAMHTRTQINLETHAHAYVVFSAWNDWQKTPDKHVAKEHLACPFSVNTLKS